MMSKQSTATILMVPPDHFGFNSQTAKTNPFQHAPENLHNDTEAIRKSALSEFTKMVKKLRQKGITVHLLPNRSDVKTPDAVFPNNWFSHHAEKKIVLYPIQTVNRRSERQKDALLSIITSAGIATPTVIDLSKDEEKDLFLESTGSMIFDREHRVAFAMASPRTIKKEFEKWCRLLNYKGVFIQSTTQHVKAVYHTNINMCVGSEFAVICFAVIGDKKEQEMVRKKLENLGKEIVEISLEQVYQFCGNILELSIKSGEKIIVMSKTAKKAFTKNQIACLKKHGKIVSFSIPTIEAVGGGGVRCMIGELFSQENT
jgi:hypothetical protein